MAYESRWSDPGKTGRMRDLKVAIVDNSISISEVLRDALAVREITKPRVYNDDEEALFDIVRERKPDIVFLNWCGDKNDPLRFAKIVRRKNLFPYPFLPLVIVLSNVTRTKVISARNAGIDEFLAVPFSPQCVFQRIQSILSERRGFVDVPTYFGPDRRRGAMATYLGCERRSESVLIDPRDGRVYLSTADNKKEYMDQNLSKSA